jgi:hypothetical protein
MRGIVLVLCATLCAFVAHSEEGLGLTVLPEGGFAPRGAGFRVTFRFAELELVSKPTPETSRVLVDSRSARPAGEWSAAHGGSARLDLCCAKCPLGLSDVLVGAARLRLTNPTEHACKFTLAVSIAPESAIYALAFDRHAFFIEGRLILVADAPARGAILADSPFAERSLTPQGQAHVESAKGQCRGEMIFDLLLQPGETQTLGFLCPVKLPEGREPGLDFYRDLSIDDLFTADKKGTLRLSR